MNELTTQEKGARDAPEDLKNLRAATYSRLTGGHLNDYALLSTCALLDHVKILEEQVQLLQGYISSMQDAAAEVYNRDTDTY